MQVCLIRLYQDVQLRVSTNNSVAAKEEDRLVRELTNDILQ